MSETAVASGLPAATPRSDTLDVAPSDVLLTLALYLDGVLPDPPARPATPAPSPGLSGLPGLPATPGPQASHVPCPPPRTATRKPKAPKARTTPSRPSRPRSAFTLFREANRKDPDCLAMWNNATDEEKKPFLDRHAALRRAYKKRVEAFEMRLAELNPTEKIKKAKSADSDTSDTPSNTPTSHEVTVWKPPALEESPPMCLNQGASLGADVDGVISTQNAQQPNQQLGFLDTQLVNNFNPLHSPFFQNTFMQASPLPMHNTIAPFQIMAQQQPPMQQHPLLMPQSFINFSPATTNSNNGFNPTLQYSVNHASASSAAFVPSFTANQAFQASNRNDSVVPTTTFGFDTIASFKKEGGCQEFDSFVELLNQ
ncbi:hypothetical protein HDU98_007746 [Podochytrium sp. JEL0797]|nr:hypothetical protein HDU98_007746 [Podochytrium sp. JEL0797]